MRKEAPVRLAFSFLLFVWFLLVWLSVLGFKPWSLRLIDKTSFTTVISSALLNLYFHISFFSGKNMWTKNYISHLISLNFEHYNYFNLV